MVYEEMIVLGAAGGIGRQAVVAGLAAGYRVIAVMRTPAKLDLTHERLTVVKGDVLDGGSYESYVSPSSAVVCAIGVRGNKPTTLYSEGVAMVLQVMGRRGARRVFFISASAVEISPALPMAARFLARYILQRVLREMYDDLRRMEGVVRTTGVDWTIIRPPRLTNGKQTGRYRFAVNRWLKNALSISRADVGDFIVQHAGDEAMYRGLVEIGY